MRTSPRALALAVVSLAAVWQLAIPVASQSEARSVAIDVVAVDGNGRPVDGLQQSDFQVREDGRAMALTSFSSSVADGTSGGRSVVLLLDDSAVPPQLTSRVQEIARAFVSRTGASDHLSVVRLSHRREEAVGDRKEALMRIAEYRGGAVPFFGRGTIEDALNRIAVVSRGFDQFEAARRAIVVIGSPRAFDIDEPLDRDASLIWPYWVRALGSAARAHASVYVIDPGGLRGRLVIERNGVVARTGGASFYNRNDFRPAVQQVWQDLDHYYLLGYAPPSSKRELHDIDVTTSRPGVKLRARRTRAN